MKLTSFFPRLVLFFGLSLSIMAAYYSIWGIQGLFGGAMSVGILMGMLEASKLVMTTFLFRYWHRCNHILKIYSLISILILMVITSTGIGGGLISLYQKSSIQNKILSQKIELIESQKVTYNSELEQYKKKIEFSTQIRNSQEKRLNDALQNESITKNIVQLQEIQSAASDFINKTDNDIIEQNKNIQVTRNSISELDKTIFNIKLESYQQKDILTFQFVADIFGTTISKVVKWLIIILIFVFDPLAICMLMAYNTIIFDINADSGVVSSDTPTIKNGENVSTVEPLYKKILRKPFNRFHGR